MADEKKVLYVRYVGIRKANRCAVAVETVYEGYSRDTNLLDPRYDLRNHSPDGFNWGYAGSGPAQLALAICAHALQGRENADGLATSVYQDFKFRTIGRIKENAFVLFQDEVLVTIDALLKEKAVVNERTGAD